MTRPIYSIRCNTDETKPVYFHRVKSNYPRRYVPTVASRKRLSTVVNHLSSVGRGAVVATGYGWQWSAGKGESVKPSVKRFDVLDRGYVELQDIMGNDLAIVNAARVSFLGESKGEASDKKLLFWLMKHRHTSPFEQVEFKFRIKAPLVVWWQLVRHRTATFTSLNLQSGRYLEFEQDEFYVPEEWRRQSLDNKQGSAGAMDSSSSFMLSSGLQNHIDDSFMLYQSALAGGVAKEQARLFLPAFCLYYTGIMKIDAHNLMHLLSLRMADDAQWEIRQYANCIYDNVFKPALPWAAEAFELYK